MSETVFAQPQNVLDTTVARIADALEDMVPSNVCVDISTSLPANGWSNSAPYTQDWMNNKVTDECGVKVEFPTEAANTGVTYLEYEKVAGGVKFTAPIKPTVAIPVIVHIINAEAESITSISADMVSTSAVSGAANVDEALSEHEQDISTLNSNLDILGRVPNRTSCGTLDAVKSAISTAVASMPNNSVGYITLALTAIVDPFAGGDWITQISKTDNNYYSGFATSYSISRNAVYFQNQNGIWKFDQLALNSNKPDKKSVGLSANQSFTLTLESGHAYLITTMTTSADSQIVQMISKVGSDVKKAVLSQGSYSSYFTESLTASAWTFTNGSYASYVNVIDF